MIEGLKQLIDLQQHDDELLAAEQEFEALPGKRQEQADRRAAVEAECEGFRQAVRDAEADQRRAETEAQDAQALLQRLEGQQFQVKSNEAYTALLREIEQAKEAISAAETRVLEAMETIDTAGTSLGEAEKQAEATLAGVAEQERAIDARQEQLGARIEDLRKAREAICTELESELLAQYQRIAARRRPAIAVVGDEMCLGCRIHVPPQLQIELLRGEKLGTCPRCHRILIHPKALEAAK